MMKDRSSTSSRIFTAKQLMYKYEVEPSHPIQVSNIALALFDELEELHRFGNKERDILNAGALLHDIGWAVSSDSHHKHSMKLILKGLKNEWKQEQILMVANVARYHRKSMPSLTHKKYMQLKPDQRRTVDKLAALVRIADGLDRSHSGYVSKLKCDILDSEVRVTLTCKTGIGQELYGFEKKKDLFEHAYRLPIIIHDIKSKN